MKNKSFRAIKASLALIMVFVLVFQSSPTFAEDSLVSVSSFTIEEYQKSSASDLSKAVRDGRVSPEQLVNFAYQIIEEKDQSLNAMITLRKELALETARTMQDTGQPFYGVPVLIKGLGHTVAGGENANGLKFLEGTISRGSGRITKAFEAEGFIVIGQTNYPELGLKNITNSMLYGPTGNPNNPNYQAGGSSGGAASGVVAGYAPVASASDAGGSIRIPASWTGSIGLKPSQGAVLKDSDNGKNQTVNFAMTKTIEDTEALFQVFENLSSPDVVLDPSTVKIAYSTESPVGTYVSPEAIKAVSNAVEFLREQGFQVEEAKPDVDGEQLMRDYYTLATTAGHIAKFQAKQKLKRELEPEDVDITTWLLAKAAEGVTKEDHQQAWDSIAVAKSKMQTFYGKYTLFLTPTTAMTAPLLEDTLIEPEYIEKIKNVDQLDQKEKMQLVYDHWLKALSYTPFTQLANLTGDAAISLPTFVSKSGLPLGIQFMAPKGQDKLLLKMGGLFETHGKFNEKDEDIEIVVPSEIEVILPNTVKTDSSDSYNAFNNTDYSLSVNLKEEPYVKFITIVIKINDKPVSLNAKVGSTWENIKDQLKLYEISTDSVYEFSHWTVQKGIKVLGLSFKTIEDNPVNTEIEKKVTDDLVLEDGMTFTPYFRLKATLIGSAPIDLTPNTHAYLVSIDLLLITLVSSVGLVIRKKQNR